MLRSQALRASVTFLGLEIGIAMALASANAQQDNGHEGPAPVDSTQSLSAGANDDLGGRPAEDDARRAEAEEGTATTSGHGGGAYGGVVPGAPNKLRKPAPAAKGPPTITWPGFQMRPDGSSRVFIQSTKAIEPKVLTTGTGKFEVQLPGARIADKTNRLPLDTRFFNTPVTKVSVNAAHSGAIVMLDMRAPVTPQVNSEQGPSGYYFTYIELPKGDYLKGTGASAAAGDGSLPTLHQPPPMSKTIGKPAAASSVSVSPKPRGARASARAEGTVTLGR